LQVKLSVSAGVFAASSKLLRVGSGSKTNWLLPVPANLALSLSAATALPENWQQFATLYRIPLH